MKGPLAGAKSGSFYTEDMRGSPRMADQLFFVSADSGTGQVKQLDRERIRSRCMRGKNKKADSRRSLQAARRAARPEKKTTKMQLQPPDEVIATDTIIIPAPSDGNSASSLARKFEADSEDHVACLWQCCSPNLGPGVVQLIHHDTVTYPREFVFNCASSSPLLLLSIVRFITLMSGSRCF